MKALVTFCAFFCASISMADGLSCEDLYKKAVNSGVTVEAISAIESCQINTQINCLDKVNESERQTGDGRYVIANCTLNGAVGGNISVSGAGTKACLKAADEAQNSPSTYDQLLASETCDAGTLETCKKEAGTENTGDSRYIMAVCMARAAHGAYQATK